MLYIHALNPLGLLVVAPHHAGERRLNRNFHDFSQPLPASPGYDAIAAPLVLLGWPPSAEVDAALQRHVAAHGQRAAAGGDQRAARSSEGIFYGGRNPTWSHVTLRHVLQEHGRQCAAGLDRLHTGLRPSGVGAHLRLPPR